MAYTGQTGQTNPLLSQTRQQVISSGANPAEVDAFIAREGGARTSDQRLLSAFGVGGVPGTSSNVPTAGGGSSYAPTGGSGAGGGSMPASVAGLAKVVTPPTGASTTGNLAGIGGAGGAATGAASVSGLMGDASGSLRALGRRMPPMESTSVAERGKRVY